MHFGIEGLSEKCSKRLAEVLMASPVIRSGTIEVGSIDRLDTEAACR